MEKNVGSVDLEELKKAREELNRDMGIENDPNMYSDYNPNRKNEQASAEQAENQTAESLDDTETQIEEETADESSNGSENSFSGLESFEINSDEEGSSNSSDAQKTTEQKSDSPAESSNPDFSVYDNFAEFDIGGNGGSEADETEKEEAEGSVELENSKSESEVEVSKESSETKETEGAETKTGSDFNTNLDDIDIDFSGFFVGNDDEKQEEPKSEETPAETETEQKSDGGNFDFDAAMNDILADLDSEIEKENTETEQDEEDEADTDSQSEESDSETEEVTQEAQSSESETEEENLSASADDEPKSNDEILKEISDIFSTNSETTNYSESSELSEEEKIIKRFNDSEAESEKKIKDAIANYGTRSPKKAPFKTIENVEFIDLISTTEFENLDKFAYVLGNGENGELEFATVKDMFNVAVFSRFEDSSFRFLSSMLLSLMLKNTKDTLNFLICDSKPTSILEKFSDSSFLAKSIAKSQNEILKTLSGLVEEIDSRYESIAMSGTKNIDEYNSAMETSYIAGFPYLILIFNNYSQTTYMENSSQIVDALSYILKFGKLVGVYAYVVSQEDILAESINYNLATRISFSAESEVESTKALGVLGAERLDATDEFVVKTIYSEKLRHIKAPNITVRELELLIQNLEG